MDQDSSFQKICDVNERKYARCPRRAAIELFAVPKFYALARKVIFRLQRTQRTGFYSDYYEFKSAWDEYCFDSQNGDGGFESIRDSLLRPILRDVASKVPASEALLLTLQAYEDLEAAVEQDADGDVEPDARLIANNILDTVREYARTRDVLKFDPLERD